MRNLELEITRRFRRRVLWVHAFLRILTNGGGGEHIGAPDDTLFAQSNNFTTELPGAEG